MMSSSLLGDLGQTRHSPHGIESFFKSINEARSEAEERMVVEIEMDRISKTLQRSETSLHHWCHLFPQVFLCSSMGYDVSFSHVYAIKLASQGRGRLKRAGYLACTILLDHVSTLTILLIATIVKDIDSSSILDKMLALNAAAELVSSEHLNTVLPSLLKAMRQRDVGVRQRAVHCLQALLLRSPAAFRTVLPDVCSRLRDGDLGVVEATVTLIYSQLDHNGHRFPADLGLTLLSLLYKLSDDKRSKSAYLYKGVTAPWLRIRLIRTLAHLGSNDIRLAEEMMPVLRHILSCADGKQLIWLAVVEETLRTIPFLASGKVSLFPPGNAMLQAEHEDVIDADCKGGNSVGGIGCRSIRLVDNAERRFTDPLHPLLDMASTCVSMFLKAEHSSLKYIGLQASVGLASIHTGLILQHQPDIVQCLRHDDDVIRGKALTLLQVMTSQDNVEDTVTAMLPEILLADRSCLQANVLQAALDMASMTCDLHWYHDTVLMPVLGLPLPSTCREAACTRMLHFFSDACITNPMWADYCQHLLSSLVSFVHDRTVDVVLIFVLKVVRSVKFDNLNHLLDTSLLNVCCGLIGRDGTSVAVKQHALLCLHHLVMNGTLDMHCVRDCVRSLVRDLCMTDLPPHFRQIASELISMTSGQYRAVDMQAFSRGCSINMDFTLSFLDTYCSSLCDQLLPMRSTLPPAPRSSDGGRHDTVRTITLSVATDGSMVDLSTTMTCPSVTGTSCGSSHVSDSSTSPPPPPLPVKKRLRNMDGSVGDNQASHRQELSPLEAPVDNDANYIKELN